MNECYKMFGVKEDTMKKISVILIGIVAVTIGILSIPKEEKKVLIEAELNNENTLATDSFE